jgi:hypothetical protein
MRRLLVTAALTTGLALSASGPASAAPVQDLDLALLGRTAEAGEAGAEISTFDPATERAFVTNAAANTLDVFDLSDPSSPAPLPSIALGGFGGLPNSVDFTPRCGGLLAVAIEAPEKTDPGSVEFFDPDGNHLGGIGAGAQPDMLVFHDGGRRLLIANEGEPSDDGSVDPPGSVSIIDLKRCLAHIRSRTADFAGAPTRGPVRIFTPGAGKATDLEPEYIAAAGERAWVTVQEANAIGILDLEKARFEVVRSLGFKDHGRWRNALDASDEDGAINIRPWDHVLGMYQPDAIAPYTVTERHGGRGKSCARRGRPCGRSAVRLVTANEGDSRDWEFFSEESRVKDLNLDPDVFDAQAGDDENLGRLTVTTTLGDRDDDGEYERLYAFGGRSMSVLNPNGEIAFDTGSFLERFTAGLGFEFFNLDEEAGSDPDNRSDNKGPEPEGIVVGKVRGRQYAFLGLERQGGIMAFDLDATPGRARFAGYINTRDADLGPEGVDFVSASDSPTGNPLVTVTNEITGTLAILEVAPAN